MKIEFAAHAETVSALPKPYLPEIAFVGRSNVGKSSLINTLLGQRIARTSSTPGRTQGLVFFKIEERLFFVDSPGFGFAKVSKTKQEAWKELTQFYFTSRRTHRATVWVFDMRREVDELDRQMCDFLISLDKPFVLALTKCDHLKKQEWLGIQKKITKDLGIPIEWSHIFSSKTKEGAKSLWYKLEKF
ncbi:MAG: ribosome biogenesis GTP-binding protein YsxC [Deltaproteobacteria bacterium]|nr:ribosome biogenesis GTP-binding protein YsxC [Deltaproteobacteria bacterium]